MTSPEEYGPLLDSLYEENKRLGKALSFALDSWEWEIRGKPAQERAKDEAKIRELWELLVECE